MQNRKQLDLTVGSIWKQLLLFFLPIFAGTFFQQLYTTVDAMIVGRWVGTTALAAVGGATGSIINLLVGFFVGLSSGASVILSQFYGANRKQEMSAAVHTAMAMALLFGLLLTAVGLPLSPVMLGWMSTPAEVLADAAVYLRISFSGMIPMLVYNVGSALLRAVGDSRRPLYFLIAACLTNILLDVVLVAWLGWGVAGAAAATVISQVFSAVLTVAALCCAQEDCRLELRRIRLHTKLLRSITAIGLPAGLQSVLFALSNVIIQGCVNGFGTKVMAAWTTYGKQDCFFWMVVSSLGIAITTFSGQNYGAGKLQRLRKGIRVCLVLGFASSILIGALMLLLQRPIYGIFTQDEEVMAYGFRMNRVLVPLYWTYLCVEIFSGALRGVGDTVVPTLLTLVGCCVLRVIWVLGLCPIYHTLEFLLWSYPLTWTLTSLMYLVYYYKGSKLSRRKVKPREA